MVSGYTSTAIALSSAVILFSGSLCSGLSLASVGCVSLCVCFFSFVSVSVSVLPVAAALRSCFCRSATHAVYPFVIFASARVLKLPDIKLPLLRLVFSIPPLPPFLFFLSVCLLFSRPLAVRRISLSTWNCLYFLCLGSNTRLRYSVNVSSAFALFGSKRDLPSFSLLSQAEHGGTDQLASTLRQRMERITADGRVRDRFLGAVRSDSSGQLGEPPS